MSETTERENGNAVGGRMQALVSACGICQNERWRPEELRHIPIYVNGSEGVLVCPDCDNALSNHVSAMRSAANRAKRQAMLNKHVERQLVLGGNPAA